MINSEIREALSQTAISLGDKTRFGNGLVNAYGALHHVKKEKNDKNDVKDKEKNKEVDKNNNTGTFDLSKTVYFKKNPKIDKINHYLGISHKQGVQVASSYLKDNDPSVQQFALGVLKTFGNSEQLEILSNFRSSTSSQELIHDAEVAYSSIILREAKGNTEKLVSNIGSLYKIKNDDVKSLAIRKLVELAKAEPTNPTIKHLAGNVLEFEQDTIRTQLLRTIIGSTNLSQQSSPNILSYSQTGDTQSTSIGESATVSVKLFSETNNINISVYNATSPGIIVSSAVLTNNAANTDITYNWNVPDTIPPGLYKIRFSYPEIGTALYDDIFTIFVTERKPSTVSNPITMSSDTFEYNDTTANAYTVYPDSSYESYISTTGDVDYYKFTAPSTTSTNIKLHVPSDKDYDIIVTNSSGTTVANGGEGTGVTEDVNFSVSANETYYIKVWGFGGVYSNTASYTLSLGSMGSSPPTPDNFEPNNSISNAYNVSPGSSYYSYISTSTDVDYYKFTAANSGSINIKLYVPSDRDYDLEITNSSNGGVLTEGSSTGVTEDTTFNVMSGTTYYFKVYGFNGAYSSSNYALSLGTIQVQDTYEPNDITTNAYSVAPGISYSSYISSGTDVDYYKFTAASTGTINVKVYVPSDKDYDVVITDSSGLSVASSTLGTGSTEDLNFSVTSGTTYYVKVYGYNGAYSTSPYSLSLGSIQVPDTYEPNDSTASAYSVASGTNYSSYISSGTDVDYYKFIAGSTGTINVKVYVPSDKDYDVVITNSSGTSVASGALGTGSTEDINFSVTSGSTYYIKVYGYNGAYGVSTYTLSLGSIQIPDTYEPNDNTSNAYNVIPGSSYDSYISTSTDIDYYKFTAATTGNINVNLSVPSDKDYDIAVTNSAGTTVASSTAGTGTTEDMTFLVASGTSYFIKVYGFSGAYGATTYTLSLGTIQVPDTYEPNDSTANAYTVAPGSNYNSYISTTTDVDYYKFVASITGTSNVKVEVPSDKDYDVIVTNSSGSPIASGLRGTGSTEDMTFSSTAGMTYYINIYGYAGAYGTSTYTLTITSLINTYDTFDNNEPNDSTASAYTISMDNPYNSYISTGVDIDYYKFVPTQSRSYQVNLSVPSDKDYDIYVYDSNNNYIGSGTRGTGSQEQFNVNLTANNTYYVKVYGYGGAYSLSPYTLRVVATIGDAYESNDTLSSATLIQAGPTYLATIHAATDVDWYKIYLEANEGIEVIMNQIPANTNYDIALYDATSTYLTGSSQTDASKAEMLAKVVGQAGYYYVKVTSASGFDANNSYAIQATKYKGLSGNINGTQTLTKLGGPYLIGSGGLEINSGAVLNVEPGTAISVRGRNPIQVKSGGTLNFNGLESNPIYIIGATGDDLSPDRWLELVTEPNAIVNSSFVLVEFDSYVTTLSYTPPPGGGTGVAGTTSVMPSDRPEAIKKWYMDASPYKFKVKTGENSGTGYKSTMYYKDMYFGVDVEIFTEWEVVSGRLNDDNFRNGYTNYWEYVNSHFAGDTEEAKLLADNGLSSSDYRIQRLIDYRNQGKQWLKKYGYLKLSQIINPFDSLDVADLYAHIKSMSGAYWLSHNTSIVYWDKLARESYYNYELSDLEKQFIDGVIIRVELTADLPFNILSFGNNVPPVGIIGALLNKGPFKYPSVYPAPDASIHTIDYGSGSLTEIVKAYYQFLQNEGTNPIFTWWVPTPADEEARAYLQSIGLTYDSPNYEWQRLLVTPAMDQIYDIQQKYLQ